MEKLQEYGEIVNRLVEEAVACVPETWTHGTLTIETDGHRIDYRLKNDDEPGKAAISEALRDLIDELYVRMNAHGDTWTQAVLDFRIVGDSVKIQTSFEYASAPAAAAVAKKPWWRFGF